MTDAQIFSVLEGMINELVSTGYISKLGEISKSIYITEAQQQLRRIPKSKKTKTVLDLGISNITKSEIESKIQENKDHHKDNCNGIIP